MAAPQPHILTNPRMSQDEAKQYERKLKPHLAKRLASIRIEAARARKPARS